MQDRALNFRGKEQARISQRGDRKINQDRCEVFSLEKIKVLVLGDGMGGHPKGEVAAQILVDTAYRLLNQSSAENFDSRDYIENVLLTAHQHIINYGISRKPAIYPRTTAVLVVINNNMMQWSHLGDSRTYLFRHGRAHMRTLDHTRVELKRLAGEIRDSDSQSKASGRSGVSLCLGGKKKIRNIEITPPTRLQDGDILLLCSDGIWSQIREAELETTMLDENLPLQIRVTNLVNKATRAAYPHSDNATALALCWQENKNQPEERNQPEQTGEIDSALDHLQALINNHQQPD